MITSVASLVTVFSIISQTTAACLAWQLRTLLHKVAGTHLFLAFAWMIARRTTALILFSGAVGDTQIQSLLTYADKVVAPGLISFHLVVGVYYLVRDLDAFHRKSRFGS